MKVKNKLDLDTANGLEINSVSFAFRVNVLDTANVLEINSVSFTFRVNILKCVQLIVLFID